MRLISPFGCILRYVVFVVVEGRCRFNLHPGPYIIWYIPNGILAFWRGSELKRQAPLGPRLPTTYGGLCVLRVNRV